MRLIELEPSFLRIESAGRWQQIDSIAEAQGLCFLCPLCFSSNRGPVGTHGVVVWFWGRGVPDSEVPGPGRWVPAGTGYQDLTLNEAPEKSRSILLTSGCLWHGFVTDGEVT